MKAVNTLIVNRTDVAKLLSIQECIVCVEQAFRLYAQGKAKPPKVLGVHTEQGGFHIKAGVLGLSRQYFVAKVNANFPGNRENHLPTIQGVIVVCDGANGQLLALMDSIEITIVRTGAATAVAAKHLANQHTGVVTICGCGNQGRISLRALMNVRTIEKVYAFDIDEQQVLKFKREFDKEIQVIPAFSKELSEALGQSGIVVTCTPSRQPFIRKEDIIAGTFVAAVGADSEEKQELCSDLLASNKIVVDIAEQSATIGEVRHAIARHIMTTENIHAELGAIIDRQKPGRESEKEIIIFDSTGMALQDAAAASLVYEKAVKMKIGAIFNFSDLNAKLPGNRDRDISALRSWYPFR